MRLVDVPVPEVGPREVLCKVVRAGVCGTDYAIYTGAFSFVKNGAIKFPMTPGHEWSGIVEKIGSEVTNFKVGDRVVSDTGVACGECYDCLVGTGYRCKHGRAVGTIKCWDGAYGEYILMPQRHLFHLPDNVSFDQGAFLEPSGIALGSVRSADVQAGDTVLVHGTGPIGILAATLARICGASKVAITGRKGFKLDIARKMGVDATINTTKEPLREAARNLVGPDGFDRIIEASGSIELFRQSFDLVKAGGTISVVAFYEKLMDQFDIDKLVFGIVTVRGSAGLSSVNRPVLNLMAEGRLDPTPLITSRRPLFEAAKAMTDMRDHNDTRVKILMEGPGYES